MNADDEPLRIVVLAAHPDDAEIWCGGTLLKHTERGDQVTIYGLFCQTPHRVQCAERSAAALGATYRSRPLKAAARLGEDTVDEIAALSPHLLLTHWEHDTHPDHVETSRAASDLVIRLARRSVVVRAMFCFTTYHNRGRDRVFAPEFYVDVSEQWTTKMQAVYLHDDQDPERIGDDVTPLFASHGRVIGTRYAEVFTEVPLFGRLLSRIRSPATLA